MPGHAGGARVPIRHGRQKPAAAAQVNPRSSAVARLWVSWPAWCLSRTTPPVPATPARAPAVISLRDERRSAGAVVVQPFGTASAVTGPIAGAMHDQVDVAAAWSCVPSNGRPPSHSPRTGRRLASSARRRRRSAPGRRETLRHVGRRVDEARADDERADAALARAAPHRCRRVAESPRRRRRGAPTLTSIDAAAPDDHVRAVLQIAARQRVVIAVADERRPQEPEVGVIAGRRDAERRAVPPGLDGAQAAGFGPDVFDVGLDDLDAVRRRDTPCRRHRTRRRDRVPHAAFDIHSQSRPRLGEHAQLRGRRPRSLPTTCRRSAGPPPRRSARRPAPVPAHEHASQASKRVMASRSHRPAGLDHERA